MPDSTPPLHETAAPTVIDGTPSGPCLSCGRLLVGPYCAGCGQEALDLAAPTWHVLRDAIGDVTEVDGRLLRTARAFATPGLLTTEFLRGCRAPYVGPLKLFLTAGTLLTSTWIVTRGVDAQFYGFPPGGRAASDYIQTAVRGLSAAGLAIAVTSWLLSLGRRRVLDESVFALHIVAAVSLGVSAVIWIGTGWKLLWGTVAAVPSALPALPFLVYLPLGLLMLAYVMLAIRRVYGGAWWMTVVRTALLVGVGAMVETLALSTGMGGSR